MRDTGSMPQTLQTSVLWKAGSQRRFLDLLFEQILLVEKQNDGRVGKPLAVAGRVKQAQAFLHSILHRAQHTTASNNI